MDFEIGLIFIMGYLLSIAKSQTMMEVYYSAPGQEYRRIYTISGNPWMKGLPMSQSFSYQSYGTPMSMFWYPSNQYYSTLNYIPMSNSPSLSKYFLMYKNIFPNYHESKLPNLETSRKPKGKLDSSKHNGITQPDEIDYAKGIFFEDYPHLTSLLRHQKIRIDNKLDPYKLGSLRTNAPFFRP